MDRHDANSAGLLVVRVWCEDSGGFRARITWVSDLAAEPEMLTVTEPEAVLAAIRGWLEAYGR